MNWQRLYSNDRIGRVRFVQFVCLLLAIVCGYLLTLAMRDPQLPAGERFFVILVCIAAIFLPNLGMWSYLNRYILAFEVSGEQARLTLPGVFCGHRVRLLDRDAFIYNRYVEGYFVTGLTAGVYAPWVWLVTHHGRYILDDQCPDTDAVVAWVSTGKGAAQPAGVLRRRRH